MAMSPGNIVDLLSPGLKAASVQEYWDYQTDSWILKKENGNTITFSSEFIVDKGFEYILDNIVEWLNLRPTFRCVDVGDGMLVPRGFVDEFNLGERQPMTLAHWDDLVGEPPPVPKTAAAAIAKKIDNYIYNKYKSMYMEASKVWYSPALVLGEPEWKSEFIDHPDDHKLVKPATVEETAKLVQEMKQEMEDFHAKIELHKSLIIQPPPYFIITTI